jgi:hypothetical protein
MSESTTEAPVEQAAQPAPDKPAPVEDPKSTDDTDWKAEARKWEQRAKDNKAAAAELDKQRKATMTEAERQVAEAKAAGAAEAVVRFGKRLARTEFDSLAGRRNPDFDTAAALEFVDLARFVGEDGEPDVKAIKAAVERLVPAPPSGPPSFDGGARQTANAPYDMNKIMREALGRS